MALHFAKRPFNHFISTVSRFTSFIPLAFQSHIISSDYLNPQFSLHTNLTHSIPSITNAHYNHRWVSSDTGFTLHGDAEERDLSSGYSSDEHIYKSDEDPEVMNEGSGLTRHYSLPRISIASLLKKPGQHLMIVDSFPRQIWCRNFSIDFSMMGRLLSEFFNGQVHNQNTATQSVRTIP